MGGSRLDLDCLRAYVETVRRGSFSLAAEALHLSQSAVSRRIHRLEADIGQRLLERLRPAPTPTRAGLMVFTLAERTLAEWDRLLPALPAAAELSGDLHIAASSAPAEVVLPPLLAGFGERHPGVAAHVHVMNSETVEECVRRHHCDVGFLGRRARSPLLTQVPVAIDEVVLAVPRRHRLAARDAVTVAELAGEAFVVREPGSGTFEVVLAALTAAGLSLPPHRCAAEVGGGHAHLAAIAAGQGIGFVSALLVARAHVGVHTLRLDDVSLERPITMLFDPRRLTPSAKVFVDFVRVAGGRPSG